MEKTGLSQERLFAELRFNSILQLGEVERLYIEANGALTLIKAKEPANGLSVLPIQDEVLVGDCLFDEKRKVCGFCGVARAQKSELDSCDNCGKHEWQPAMNA